MRNTVLAPLAIAFTVLVAGGRAQAESVVGTQGIVDSGTTTADTDSINTATSYTLDVLVTTGSQTGDFATFVTTSQDLGSATLDVADPTSFTFGNTEFGTFVASSVVRIDGGPLNEFFDLSGTFTPGTLFTGFTPGPALLNLAFSQVGGPGTAISAAGTLTSAGVIPEPASLGLALTGGVGFALFRRLRRSAA